MNIVTVAEIKRSGFLVLEAALSKGPVQLMKRNRPSAVVLRPEDYAQLLAGQRDRVGAGKTAMEKLLAPDTGSAAGRALDANAMRARLDELDASWAER